MSQTATITEGDILSEVAGPDETNLRPELAKSLLQLRFSDRADRRVRTLLEKNNCRAITQAQRAELEKYLRVGQLIDLLQAKARLSLVKSRAAT